MKWNRLFVVFLAGIVGIAIGGCPQPPVTVNVNLCQKDPGTWECVEGGATGVLSYQPTGEPYFVFDFTAQGLDPATDYRLIYYDDTYSPWRPGKPLGMCLTEALTPQSDGSLSTSGSAQPGDLPWPDDLNCPDGAKIWLVADADLNCDGPKIMTAWNPAVYLFDATGEDLVKFNDLTQEDQPCNQAPVADAGDDQAVDLGNLVTLDGSGSYDPEGASLGYAWTLVSKPADSTAALSNPAGVNPSFTADKVGDYTVRLVVYDGAKDSDPDEVTVTASAPTATVDLCEKDSSWSCVTTGGSATLTYTTVGNPDFTFSLTAQGLAASTNYTLIYYPDPWPGNGLICLGSKDSNADGTLSLSGTATPGDLPWACDQNCGSGAKIWLVPTSYLNCTGQTMPGWCNPGASCTQILFDTQLITFDDLSDDPGSCTGGGC